MKPVLSVDNMRKSDAFTIKTKTPGRELMYRAGKGVFDSVCWRGPVAVVCGSGNNAGDGYVIASLLAGAGIECEIILLSEKASEDGAYYFEICKEAGIGYEMWSEKTDLSSYAMIVDGILGTGFRGHVRGKARDAIEKINDSGAYVVSVDINSGLNGDSGMAELCVFSDITVSIGGFKSGHFLNMAKDVMKQRLNVDIGIDPVDRPYRLLEEEDVGKLFYPRKNHSNKGTYGYTALIGGSKRYPGAVRLSEMANAAMRSGAGVVKLAVPEIIYKDILPLILESTLFPLSGDAEEVVFREQEIAELISNVKTVAFGMGVGTGSGAAQILKYLLKNFSGRLIVDADGLNILSGMDKALIRNAKPVMILTPHIMEFSRLTGMSREEILTDPVNAAEEYAGDTGVILLLKGPCTIVTDGSDTYLVDRGCSGMATAGSGDVLSGIAAAVLGYAADPLLGTAAAAFVNGMAGELAQSDAGSVAMIASDTVSQIKNAVSRLGKSVAVNSKKTVTEIKNCY